VVCGEPIGGAEVVVDERGQVVAVRMLPPGPGVCLWCLPAFLRDGGELTREEVVGDAVGDDDDA